MKLPRVMGNQAKTYKTIQKNVSKIVAPDTQMIVSKKTGISQASFSKQMHGNAIIMLSSLIAIADAYNVPLAKLVERKEDLNRYTSLEDAVKALLILDRVVGLDISLSENERPIVRIGNNKYDSLLVAFKTSKEYNCLGYALEDIIPFLENYAEG